MSTEPDTKQKLGIVRNNLRMFGLARTLFDIIGYLFTAPPRDRFDRKYGVKTGGNIEKAAVGVTDVDAIKYVPAIEPVMRDVIAHAARFADLGQLSFVDLGCGKGRALIMASWYPFRAVHGVELVQRFADVAQDNITAYLARPRREIQCSKLTVACANALHCDFPDGDLLIFLHRPFKGQVFQAVLDRLHDLAARSGRRVLVVYICPVDQKMLDRHPGYAQLHDCQVIVKDHSWSLWECRPVAAAAAREAG